jgi:AraC family transcriptional regulator
VQEKRGNTTGSTLWWVLSGGIVMDWISRLNEAITHIEEHLGGDIDYDVVAGIACCSTFHFIRMFSYIAGIPLSEYIRRRRMTKAASDVQAGRERILDIALRYGYESPTAFTRAFHTIHGMSPSEARTQGKLLTAYPRIVFSLSITGGSEMNYRIENKEQFPIVGVREHFVMNNDQCFTEVPLFWQQTVQQGKITAILGLLDREPFGLLGVSTCMNGKDFDYYIAVASTKEPGDGMESYLVPSCTWAIFDCIGPMPQAIQDLQKRIITEWLPSSGYEYANAPDIELYYEGDQQAPDYRCEVWIPIVKK